MNGRCHHYIHTLLVPVLPHILLAISNCMAHLSTNQWRCVCIAVRRGMRASYMDR